MCGPVYLGMIASSLFRNRDTEAAHVFRGAAALGWVLLLSIGIIAAQDSLDWMGVQLVASLETKHGPLDELEISSSRGTYAVSIPRSAVRGFNRVAIAYAYAESPLALGRSNDPRTLAVRYRSFRFTAIEDRR